MANGQNDAQAQQPSSFFQDLAAGKTADPLASKSAAAPSTTPSAMVPKTPTPIPTPIPTATPAPASDFFHDLASQDPAKDIGSGTASQTPGPAPGTFHRGLDFGFQQGMGFTAPDPNNPHSLEFSDMAKQFWENLQRSAGQSYARLGGIDISDPEKTKGIPVWRLDVPVRSALATAVTPFDMIASGIEGMATTLENGGKELVEGLRKGDHERIGRGTGKVIASLGQLAMGMDDGLPARTLTKASEYAPRAVEGSEVTGPMRPANVFQGPINRSVGAIARDVRFGDPSKALVEEGIAWPGTKGRLAQVNAKLAQIGPQLQQALSNAKGAIKLDDVLDPIIKKYKDKIRLSNESDATKKAAYDDLNTLRNTAHEHAPSGNASAAEANGFKQAIGDSVNWEKRPTPMHDTVVDAYRESYGAVRDQVNNLVGSKAADLNRRISNLRAAQSALRETYVQQKAGRTPGLDITHPFNAAKSLTGNVAPLGIKTAQKGAEAAPLGAGALVTGFQQEDTRNWIPIQTSDSKQHLIHPEDLAEAQRRDPKLKVLDKPQPQSDWVHVQFADDSVHRIHPADVNQALKQNPGAKVVGPENQ